MATEGSGLDLGDVGFSLSADYSGLDRALNTLRRFGDAVNTWEKRTDESSQRVTAAYMRQEKAMVGMYQRMSNLQSQMHRMQAPTNLMDAATQSINRYVNTLTLVDKFGNPIARSALEMQRAGAAAAGEVQKLQNKLKDWNTEAKRTEQGMRKLAELDKTLSKQWGSQLLRSIAPQSGIKAADSATTFQKAGLLQPPMDSHIAAWQKQQAAIQRTTQVLNANANAHVLAYQTQLRQNEALVQSVKSRADAHVYAYKREQEAAQRRDASIAESLAKANSAAQARVTTLVGQAKRSFVPDDMIRGYTDALQAYQAKTSGGVASARELATAQRELQASLLKTTQQIKDYTASQTAASRAEKFVQSATFRVKRVNEQAYMHGLPSKYSQENITNLQGYQQALYTGDSNKAAASLKALNASLAQTQQMIAGATAHSQKFSSALRGVERATILAMGPLSGVGARVAVMAALFESTSAKAALLIAGLTGVGFTVGSVAAAAVHARIQWEQWNSLLIASSGSVALAGGEFEYVTGVADKYGQAIQSLIPSYGSFATSARLANVSLEDQKKIFEAFTTAGAALHWTTEQSGRAFLALEQMMSKGVVQSQEMKLQLGQVLPGALELAAKSAGKTTSEFMKMMEQGEVLTADFAPKFAATVERVFREAAKYGAQAIQADINRFTTGRFEVAKSFDEAIKASQLFHSVLREVNSLMGVLEKNAGTVVAGFVAGLAVLTSLYIPAILAGLGKIITHMKTMTVLGSVMTAATSGNIVKAVAQIGVMAAVGYGTFKLLDKAMKDTTDKTQQVIDKQAVALSSYKALGEISKREKEAHIAALKEAIKEAQARERAVIQEIMQTDRLIAKTKELGKARAAAVAIGDILKSPWDAVIGEGAKVPSTNAEVIAEKKKEVAELTRQLRVVQVGGDSPLNLDRLIVGDPEKIKAKLAIATNQLNAMLAAVEKGKSLVGKKDPVQTQIQQLQDMLKEYDNLVATEGAGVGDKADKDAEKLKAKYENVYNTVSKLFTDVNALEDKQVFIDAQFKLGPLGAEEIRKALDRAEAQKEVADFFEGLKDKTKAAFSTKIAQDFQAAFTMHGIEGNSLEEKLVNLKVRMKEMERSTQASADSFQKWSENAFAAEARMAELSQALTQGAMDIARLAADFNGSSEDKYFTDILDNREKNRAFREKLLDVLLNTNLPAGNEFAEHLNLVDEQVSEQRKWLDRIAEFNQINNRANQSNDIVSATEASLQSRTVIGLESEVSARIKLRKAIGEQGRALQKDLMPQIVQFMETLQPNSNAYAQLQALIDKIKEMVAVGEQISGKAGIKKAFDDYANDMTDAFETAYGAVRDILSKTEDALVELAMTGKVSFSDMANSIISDLIRIQIRQNLLGPIAGALGNMGTNLFSGIAGLFLGSAQGNAFSDGPGLSAYRNTVVTQPTVFPFAKGGVGLMGEKNGSPGEAIMPLTRAPNGDLAVSAVGMGGSLGGLGGNIIDINITFNDNRTSSETSTSSGEGNQGAGNMGKLAQMIKSSVHSVLLQEMRPGGILS